MSENRIYNFFKKPLNSLIGSILVYVFIPIILGVGFDVRYRLIVIGLFIISLIILVSFTIWFANNNTSNLNPKIFFPVFLCITMLFLSIIMYLIPYRSFFYDPEKYAEEYFLNLIQTQERNDLATDNLPTIDSTKTQEPTESISTKETNPESYIVLFDDCLSVDSWNASNEVIAKKVNNCWDVPGLVATNGNLEIYFNKYSIHDIFGIYTPFEDFSNIKIKLNIEEIEITTENNAYARLFFGIVPNQNPIPTKGLMFSLQKEKYDQSKALLKYRLPNEMYTTSLNQYITYKEGHQLELHLINKEYVKLIFDGIELKNKFSLPDDPTYFWLGYETEGGKKIFASIEDITFF